MSSGRVRLYAGRELVPPGAPHAPFLEPLWGASGDKYDDPRSPIAGRFRAWRSQGAELLEEAPLEGADVALLPAGWESSALPLLRSRRGEREHMLPAFALDVVEELGAAPPPREWRPRPTVGFCGYVPDIGARGWPRRRARRLLRRSLASVRTEACRSLGRSRDVETRFVFRPAYWAGAVGRQGELDYAAMRAARAECVRNVVDSDYVLAVRGGGNFSVRLYEALSCGRIPIFVDTDSALPCEDQLDWRSLCVWLDESELSEIGAIVASLHAELGPRGFADRQRECRRAYLEWLSPEAFFGSLARGLRRLAP